MRAVLVLVALAGGAWAAYSVGYVASGCGLGIPAWDSPFSLLMIAVGCAVGLMVIQPLGQTGPERRRLGAIFLLATLAAGLVFGICILSRVPVHLRG